MLPSERLTETGVPKPELRAELRAIPSWRNAITVTSAYLQAFGSLVVVDRVVERTGWWWLWVPMFVLQGRAHALFGILSHEGTHRLLFATQKWNDRIANWLIAPVSFSLAGGLPALAHGAPPRPAGAERARQDALRRLPGEPPVAAAQAARDLTGESGWKILKGFARAWRNPVSRGGVNRIIGAQIILAIVLGVAVGWWAWPLMWFLPYMTVWRVINRLRAIAEHGGMVNSKDERLTTHHVRQSLLARFWMVPYHTGWHIAPSRGCRHPVAEPAALPRGARRRRLRDAGLEYPSYRSLWRALSSRP